MGKTKILRIFSMRSVFERNRCKSLINQEIGIDDIVIQMNIFICSSYSISSFKIQLSTSQVSWTSISKVKLLTSVAFVATSIISVRIFKIESLEFSFISPCTSASSILFDWASVLARFSSLAFCTNYRFIPPGIHSFNKF